MDINQKFEAMSKDEDVIRIARKASKKFINQLSAEEIDQCILIALWNSVQGHDPVKGLKFTTYLYRGVIMECLSQKKLNTGTHKVPNLVCDKYVMDRRNSYSMVDLMDEIESDPNKDVLIDKYINNLSTKEIASNYGVCLETIRKKIAKSKKKRRALVC